MALWSGGGCDQDLEFNPEKALLYYACGPRGGVWRARMPVVLACAVPALVGIGVAGKWPESTECCVFLELQRAGPAEDQIEPGFALTELVPSKDSLNVATSFIAGLRRSVPSKT